MQVPLSDWSAWAPGLNSPEKWRRHLHGDLQLAENEKPDVSFLPAMFRRKLSPLGRMLFYTANSLGDKSPLNKAPLVFASRHGELDLSISLINSGLNALPCSPAKFSMSVHNSPIGLFSIQNRNTRPSTAVSAGRRTLEMGITEALCTAEEYGDALLIYADLPLSEDYKNYVDENEFPVCLALYFNKLAASQDLVFKNENEFQALELIRQLLTK